ncbi:MAG: acyl-CoA thioesterase [Kangiellaceae bacterium]|nr:acyl-CoA thioesterase [Kangiellaceae bacterium]MCW8997165.1 acyl-CoA thioesterase [Kangiellaceae bacterium]MCW9017955.1 acyl-CoA thioesterase [Kangiellaceae bacterium]
MSIELSKLDAFKQQFSHTIEIPVIWGDMDAFQHINNTVYFRYFENVRIEYFDLVGINQLMAKEKIGPILGETACRYQLPLTYPDTVTIGTKVSAIKEKRFTMQYEIFSHKQQGTAAKGMGEIVYMDYNKGKTCLIPESIVQAIEKLEKSGA